jgi:transposase
MTEKKPRKQRTKPPTHAVEVRTYGFPIETSARDSDKFFRTRDLCWELRNLLTRERAENRATNRLMREAGQTAKYLSRSDQYVRVSQLTKTDRRFAAVHSQVLQNVAQRVDEGTKRWLEAHREGRKHVKPPRAIDKHEYVSFTFPQYGFAARIKRGKLCLSKLGEFRLLDYRKIRGRPKTVTVKWDAGRWWAFIACEIQAKDVYRSAKAVEDLPDTGIDTGLTRLFTTAHGEAFDPPRALKDALGALRHAQRDMSRKFRVRETLYVAEQTRRKCAGETPLPALRDVPYSNRLKAQIRRVAKIHTKVARVRDHHHKKNASVVESRYRLVAVEEHSVQFMIRNRKQARAAADRGIFAQKQALRSKLGVRYTPVANQRPGIGGNSQTCLCGETVPKELKDRIHECPKCGLVEDRDVVSANIAMLIAFGRAHLSSPAAGQAVVRRGETEAGMLCMPGEPQAASEVSVSRQSPADQRRRKTGGGEPTPEAKTPVHRPENRCEVRRKPSALSPEGLLGSTGSSGR